MFSGVTTNKEREFFLPSGYPPFMSRQSPIFLPRDTRTAYSNEMAKALSVKERRPDVVITKNFGVLSRRPRPNRSIGIFQDRVTLNRKDITSSAYAIAATNAITREYKAEHTKLG